MLRLLLLLVFYGFNNSSYAEVISNETDSYGSLIVGEEITPLLFGAKGDGVTDDTVNLQKAFTACSSKGITCRIPAGKNFLVTSPVFLWGGANLKGDAGMGIISFNVHSGPYLLNIGISGKNRLEKVFTGEISGIKFKVSGGIEGRIIYFWRSDGARIVNNIFDVGEYAYSATSSGNDNNWVRNGFKNSIRKNISIIGNKIIAKSGAIGSEGIGLGHFDGVVISKNTITGVGDDPIGIHFCMNIRITDNFMKSVDGRLFVVNSKNVVISNNKHERIPSPKDNKFYKGISLMYIGFEILSARNHFSSPTNIHIYDNYLYYPPGSIDAGAAIYLYGPRSVVVERNRVVNDSSSVIASGVHILPAKFSAGWDDPDKIDRQNTARVWDVTVENNYMNGKYPQKIIMTGNCVEYKGKIFIRNNMAMGYQLYCPNVLDYSNGNMRSQ